MWATFAVIGVAIFLFASELAAMELVALGVIVALVLLFQFLPAATEPLAPDSLLSGFSSPALITILALLVVGQGLHQSGAFDGLITRLSWTGRRRAGPILLIILLVACLVSAFLNNTPIVVMFIPVVAALAGRFGIGASAMLMPLSYIAILGGMLTLVGSSTNLLVADLASHSLGRELKFFELLVPGSIIAAAGAIYTLFVAPRLLTKSVPVDGERRQDGRQFIAQIDVTTTHPFDGAKSIAGMFRELPGISVQMIRRGLEVILPPFEDIELRPGDQLVMATTRTQLTDALNLRAQLENDDPASAASDVRNEPWLLAEAAVAPGSNLSGQFLSREAFLARTGCHVIGILRHKRMKRDNLQNIRLRNGDVLLIAGMRAPLAQLRRDRDLLVLEGSVRDLHAQHTARKALFVFAATILAAASGLVPIMVAALTGALVMVACGCLNIQQATRAINLQIVLLVAAGVAMALALQATGGARYLAMGLLGLTADSGPIVILALLFALVAIMTNVLSNNATALIFTPIAIDLARQTGMDPTPFVHAVIFAANCSFVSPIGYQTNLLVMGPGNYRYVDFVRVGTPLAILVWLVFCAMAPWYYGLGE
jgi:di/tricarboxylate transporter